MQHMRGISRHQAEHKELGTETFSPEDKAKLDSIIFSEIARRSVPFYNAAGEFKPVGLTDSMWLPFFKSAGTASNILMVI